MTKKANAGKKYVILVWRLLLYSGFLCAVGGLTYYHGLVGLLGGGAVFLIISAIIEALTRIDWSY